MPITGGCQALPRIVEHVPFVHQLRDAILTRVCGAGAGGGAREGVQGVAAQVDFESKV